MDEKVAIAELNKLLKRIGLSDCEANILIYLIRHPVSKAEEIMSSLNIGSSSFYNTINSLIKRGFVKYVEKNKIKHYSAVSLEELKELLQMEIKIIEKISEFIKTEEGRKSEIFLFKGEAGLRSMVAFMLSDAEKKDVWRFFSPQEEEYKEMIEKVYVRSKRIRELKKIKGKGILPIQLKGKISPSKITEHRFLEKLPPNILIFRDKIGIISPKEEAGFVIQSKDIANKFADFFDWMWERAEK
ncbi:MAG: hypothetical protein NZ903_00745 [Candidatus Micrarchaeota archaeon]|nr:hypothetical protein [Candidatus Micrarchaeota archaeon]